MKFFEKDGEKYVVIGKGKTGEPPLIFVVCHNKCCDDLSNMEAYPKDKPISGMGKCKVCGHVHDYS